MVSEKRGHMKKTKQREIIIKVLKENDCPLTAEEIYAEAIKNGSVNISTIYRTLGTLCETGKVYKIWGINNKAVYQATKESHRHYIVCEKCKTAVYIGECPLNELTLHLKKETGYMVTGHSLMFTGLCPKCEGITGE